MDDSYHQSKDRASGSYYLDVACAFDIETTSFYQNVVTNEVRTIIDGLEDQDDWEKRACMYAWVFGINGKCVVGRTWGEFIETMHKVSLKLGLDYKSKRLVCYIHNEAFEFQFFRKLFQWESVFATKDRTPVKCLTSIGIEFRCSLILSGYSLAKVGEHLQTYKVKKMVGDLDYSLLRHHRTKLLKEEWNYIIHDGLVVMAYIQELLDQRKRITRIPLTKTGFVREYTRRKCFWDSTSHSQDHSHKYAKYRALMESLTLDPSEYLLLRQAFHGGLVHANAVNANKVLHDVASYDFTSSYPSVIVSEKFPMSKGTKVMPKSPEELNKYLSLYLCVMDVTFIGLESIATFEHIMSVSKCTFIEDCDSDNGRIINASKARISITNVDLESLSWFYRWKEMIVHTMYVYRKGYLPKDFVLAVLDLYEQKTKLKGVPGKEAELMWSKENLNANFGMCVTDICRDETKYDDGEWKNEPAKIEESIKKYNEKKSRFLSYAWGVFITAYAMRNLCTGIVATGKRGDYCYCDTDSVKVMHHERYADYFESYNNEIIGKLESACKFHGIDFAKCAPKNIKGEVKPMGVWDFEGVYKRAKFLGAKRYAVEYADGSHSITIAGVNKKTAIPALEAKAKRLGLDFFDFIEFDYTFEKDECGKLLHSYIDEPRKGVFIDYRGVRGRYEEQSYVHLEPTTYKMTATIDYLDLLATYASDYGTYID